MFLWVANFWGLTVGFACLSTLSRTFIVGYICLTKNIRFFTRGGIYLFLLYPTHVFFISFFFNATVRLILDVVPFYRAHHRTLNTVLICHVLTTYHRKPNTMSISTMYSRHTIEHQTQCRSLPCTHTHVMRGPVLKCNAMPLHVSHATCTMNATCNNSKSYFMLSIMDNHI